MSIFGGQEEGAVSSVPTTKTYSDVAEAPRFLHDHPPSDASSGAGG